MTTNPNEYYLVARERAADARQEAEQWRQRQAIRRHEERETWDSAVVAGVQSLLARLRPARGEAVAHQAGSARPAGRSESRQLTKPGAVQGGS